MPTVNGLIVAVARRHVLVIPGTGVMLSERAVTRRETVMGFLSFFSGSFTHPHPIIH